MLRFQQEARLGRAVRIEILHALTDGHWEVQAVALDALLALGAGPSEAYLDVVDAEQAQRGSLGP
jgi:hypothetical protein